MPYHYFYYYCYTRGKNGTLTCYNVHLNKSIRFSKKKKFNEKRDYNVNLENRYIVYENRFFKKKSIYIYRPSLRYVRSVGRYHTVRITGPRRNVIRRCRAMTDDGATTSASPPDDGRPRSGRMIAWQLTDSYGTLEDLSLNDGAESPTADRPGQLLVRVLASSVNPIDVLMAGKSSSVLGTARRRAFASAVRLHDVD